ncbi:hypothetical protein PLESTM_000338900 [Pleodorina starrii]|nr:hypothetical protein PLESTM_000338900 [Pleodorina starrii]
MHYIHGKRPTTNCGHRRQASPNLRRVCTYPLLHIYTRRRSTSHVGRVRLEEEASTAISPSTSTELATATATLYSNLNPKTLAHEPGTLWGATLLVAGTTVGAGILALPAVTQASGFTATTGTLAGCGAFAMATGLLIAEVNINVVARTGLSNVTFSTMAQKTLGAAGASAATLVYLFHNYALLVAYTARAGQIVASAADTTPLAGAAAFALAFGGICYSTTPRQFDQINGVLLGMAAAAFVALLGVAGTHLDPPVLARADWSAVPPTIPVIALAFVYHNIIPVVVHNLECDAAKVRTAIILGVLIPAAMYLLWDGAILGSLDNLAANAADAAAAAAAATAAASAAAAAATAATAAADAAAAAAAAVAGDGDGAGSAAAVAADAAAIAAAAAAAASASAAAAGDAEAGSMSSSAELTAALDPLVLLQDAGGPVVAPLVQVFSFLAIATSFTAFVIAAVDFLPDAFKPLAAVPRAGRYALVVLPPILLSTASPGIFFASLDIAGTYGVMTLYGMMPAAMAWASRYGGSGNGATVATVAAAADAAAAATGGPVAAAAGAAAGDAAVEGNGSGSGSGSDGARSVELMPGGPAALLLTGAAAAAVIVSQWFV